MIVYTVQGYDLRVFQGPVDLNLGRYCSSAQIVSAQRRLYEIIETDQLIWCSQDRHSYFKGEIGRFFHSIELDNRDIVAIVNTLQWEHIIGNNRHIPGREWAQMRFKSRSNEELKRLEDEYIKQHVPSDLWKDLVRPELSKSDQILLAFPLRFSTILNVDEITNEFAEKNSVSASTSYAWSQL